MNPGDIHFFDVPFENRPGSKIRPVVILQELEDECVVVVQSTSKVKPNLDLVHTINFDHPNYFYIRLNGLSGKSYFYREKWSPLPKSFDRGVVGPLLRVDFLAIQAALGMVD